VPASTGGPALAAATPTAAPSTATAAPAATAAGESGRASLPHFPTMSRTGLPPGPVLLAGA